MTEAAYVKYVYLDIVGFTKDRSVEAQTDIVAALNAIVKSAVTLSSVPEQDLILLPTGDGMAIAIVGSRALDVHVTIGLRILALVEAHNAETSDAMRTFEVRIGINQNVDKLKTDIKRQAQCRRRRDFAGAKDHG